MGQGMPCPYSLNKKRFMFMKTLIISLFLFAGLSLYSQDVENFKLKDTENQTQEYTELKGSKITLIDFWASYCKPCIKSMPYLNSLHNEYKDKGLTVIGINTDGPRNIAKVGPLCKTLGVEYPVLLDSNGELMEQLEISSLPTLLIVDAEGNILDFHEGFVNSDKEELTKKIEKYLN